MSKPIPKSLHTVKVLVRMSYLMWLRDGQISVSDTYPIENALECLGLENAPDIHNIIPIANRQIEEICQKGKYL